jgi:hypothetical protein
MAGWLARRFEFDTPTLKPDPAALPTQESLMDSDHFPAGIEID